MSSAPADASAADRPYDLLVAGGRPVCVDVGAAAIPIADIAVSDGRIAAIAPRIDAPAARRIDAGGLLVLPGLVDPHVHLSLPMRGTVSSDDIASGTAAALCGGVTTVIDFTVPQPGQRLAAALEHRRAAFGGRSHTDFALHVNVTEFGPDFSADLDQQLSAILTRGATSLKVFTCYSREGVAIRSEHLRALLRAAAARGLLVLVHAEEDQALITGETELLAAGHRGPLDFARSRPPEAEARAIAAVIEMAAEERSPVYFVHVSTAAGLAAIEAGRRCGTQPIYCETCPQYLWLDERAYSGSEAVQFILAPPLRPPRDREAVCAALGRGTVDVVATDHCPFMRAQKEIPGAAFNVIPNGLPGIETRLLLLHTLGMTRGLLDLTDLVRVCCLNPARIMGLYPRKGVLRPGADADLVLFDPAITRPLRAAELHMNTDFSPYEGITVQGRVETVLLRGTVVVSGGVVTGSGAGHYLGRKPLAAGCSN